MFRPCPSICSKSSNYYLEAPMLELQIANEPPLINPTTNDDENLDKDWHLNLDCSSTIMEEKVCRGAFYVACEDNFTSPFE